MRNTVDLDYLPGSSVGPLDAREITHFQEWLNGSGQSSIKFEGSYINHLTKYHGGVPRKRYFRTLAGTEQSITRFLNFLKGGSGGEFEQYSVPCTWSKLEERLGEYLMPFAELFAGDMLCFDFSETGRPQVVVWDHELSMPGRPHTEFVSANFDDFLNTLQENLS